MAIATQYWWYTLKKFRDLHSKHVIIPYIVSASIQLKAYVFLGDNDANIRVIELT